MAILTQLQTRKLVTATALADKFKVSVRTIYRDIKALEQSGVPVLTEEGKGYALMEGYRLPPVSFTEGEANALITAEKFVLQNKDASFVKEYGDAIGKIKAVLRSNTKANAELLSSRMLVSLGSNETTTSNYLASLQLALTNFNPARIDYVKAESSTVTTRVVEPFALLSSQENWVLVAFCRLRQEFRIFRLDRIQKLEVQNEKFQPHKLTLQDFFSNRENK